MKKLFVVALVLLVAVGMTVTAVSAGSPKTEFDVNGPHYNLNLLGKKWDMGSHDDQFNNPDRGTIFVPLESDGYSYNITKANGDIITRPGVGFFFTQNDDATDFSVIDGNAIDDGSCEVEIPAGKYQVFIEVRANNPKMDAYADIYANVFVENGTDDYYLISVGEELNIKKSKVPIDVTHLFFVSSDENDFNGYLDLETWATDPIWGYPDEYYESYGGVWVFDYMTDYFAALNTMEEYDFDLHDAQYFWDLDNNGLKQIKLRFYPI